MQPCRSCSTVQKLAQVSAANEEERKRLESQYRDRIQQFDEKLRDVSCNERMHGAGKGRFGLLGNQTMQALP